jgi:hypothetical protein
MPSRGPFSRAHGFLSFGGEPQSAQPFRAYGPLEEEERGKEIRSMRVFLMVVATVLLVALLATPAFAVGQPNKSCEDQGASPTPGFGTGGFENAEGHYAGEDNTPSLKHANSDKAVSQYDVACFRPQR